MAQMFNEWYLPSNPMVGYGYVTSGGLVLIVQTMINQGLGMTIHEDGYYGPETQGAIAIWQETFNLTDDGIVGPQTWESFYGFLSGDDTPSDPNFAHYTWETDRRSPIHFSKRRDSGAWAFQYGTEWIVMDDHHYGYTYD